MMVAGSIGKSDLPLRNGGDRQAQLGKPTHLNWMEPLALAKVLAVCECVWARPRGSTLSPVESFPFSDGDRLGFVRSAVIGDA